MNSSDFTQVEAWLKGLRELEKNLSFLDKCTELSFHEPSGQIRLSVIGTPLEHLRDEHREYIYRQKAMLVKNLADKGVTYDGP